MKKRITSILIICFLVLTFSPGAGAENRVDHLLKKMSLEEKVGQVIIGFFQGPNLSPELRDMIAKNHLGGVILYSVSGNIQDIKQVGNLVGEIQKQALATGNLPLFISIDQEGGRVARLTEGVTLFPGNMALGAVGSQKLAASTAAITARELRILGINMNFAPVIDVNSNPANPIIGIRSFGSSPGQVASLGQAMVKPYKEEGVICSAKHFPGHGDTAMDSHLGLPVINRSLEQLEKVELLPFRAMVKTGVPAVMTAHVLVPALEKKYPATMSPRILSILRKEMGFDGLIITDSLGMGAVNKQWSVAEAGVKAFQAGADLLLLGADKGHVPQEQSQIFQALLAAVRNGRISEERLNQSVRRILTAKIEYNILDQPLPRYQMFSQLASQKNLTVAEKIARESLTLVRDNKKILPFQDLAGKEIPLLWPEESKDSLPPLLKECPFFKPYLLPLNASSGQIAQAVQDLSQSPYLVIGTYNLQRNTSWVELIKALGVERVVAMAMGSPYDLMDVPQVGTYLVAYGDRPVTMTALGKLLKGELVPQGHLPVDLPGLYSEGWGMTSFQAKEAKISIPNVTREMFKSDLWINKLARPEKLIMNSGEIKAFNQQIREVLPGVIVDLTTYPASLSRKELLAAINSLPFPNEERYLNGQKVTAAYYDNLKKVMNLSAIQRKNKILYALTVKRTNLRILPTNDLSLEQPDDWEFDLFQETALGVAEPVLILHRSVDGQWYFVQTYNCRGWVNGQDLAVAKDKEEWLNYLNAKEFLVVTGNHLQLGCNPYSPEISQLDLGMGCKLPLVGQDVVPFSVDNQSTLGNYVVEIPTRGSKGELTIKQGLIPLSSDVSLGYLPYTRANILRQAFKMQGERYGWGGMFKSRDCSAFVMDVYKSFGVMLPRNSGQQGNSAGKTVRFLPSLTSKEREDIIRQELLPGATLHMNGHVMLYLGQHQGRSYIIHDLAAYSDTSFKNPDGTFKRIPVNQVIVTDLSILRRNGNSFLGSLTTGKQIED